MFSYGPRITRSYDLISTGTDLWATMSQRMLICQHEPDTGCNKTHNHIGMWGVTVQDKRLKDVFNSETGLALSGNKDWAWEHKRNVGEEVGTIPNWDISGDNMDPTVLIHTQAFRYIRYMIKGDIECVKYSRNIPRELLVLASNDWVIKEANATHMVYVETIKRRPPPYQQLCISYATEKWLLHCKEARETKQDPDPELVPDYIMDAMRIHGKGINEYMVRDLGYAVLYDDDSHKDLIRKKMRRHFIF